MLFGYSLQGHPTLVQVTHYSPYCPMVITGSGFGDAEPPEEEEFEFHLCDHLGNPRHDLDDLITPKTEAEILAHYKKLCNIR